jgi:hypothetical protein
LTGSVLQLQAFSPAQLSRVKPLRQERVGVHVTSRPDPYSVLTQQRLQVSVVEGAERLGASADMAVANEDLRDRWGADAMPQHLADSSAEIALLVVGRIEIDRAVGNIERLEQLPANANPTRASRRCGARRVLSLRLCAHWSGPPAHWRRSPTCRRSAGRCRELMGPLHKAKPRRSASSYGSCIRVKH